LVLITVLFFTILRTDKSHGYWQALLSSQQAIFLICVFVFYAVVRKFGKFQLEDLFDQDEEEQKDCEVDSVESRRNFVYIPECIKMMLEKKYGLGLDDNTIQNKLGLRPSAGGGLGFEISQTETGQTTELIQMSTPIRQNVPIQAHD